MWSFVLTAVEMFSHPSRVSNVMDVASGTCEKISDDVYDFLAKHEDVPSILWFCRKCTVTTKKMMSSLR